MKTTILTIIASLLFTTSSFADIQFNIPAIPKAMAINVHSSAYPGNNLAKKIFVAHKAEINACHDKNLTSLPKSVQLSVWVKSTGNVFRVTLLKTQSALKQNPFVKCVQAKILKWHYAALEKKIGRAIYTISFAP